MKPRIVVYTTKKTNRLVYIISTIFEERLGCELIITRDKREFLEVDGVRLNYSSESIEQIAQILPSPLLFENRIRDIEVVVNDDSEIPLVVRQPSVFIWGLTQLLPVSTCCLGMKNTFPIGTMITVGLRQLQACIRPTPSRLPSLWWISILANLECG